MNYENFWIVACMDLTTGWDSHPAHNVGWQMDSLDVKYMLPVEGEWCSCSSNLSDRVIITISFTISYC